MYYKKKPAIFQNWMTEQKIILWVSHEKWKLVYRSLFLKIKSTSFLLTIHVPPAYKLAKVSDTDLWVTSFTKQLW